MSLKAAHAEHDRLRAMLRGGANPARWQGSRRQCKESAPQTPSVPLEWSCSPSGRRKVFPLDPLDEPGIALALAQNGNSPQDNCLTSRPSQLDRITEARCVGAQCGWAESRRGRGRGAGANQGSAVATQNFGRDQAGSRSTCRLNQRVAVIPAKGVTFARTKN